MLIKFGILIILILGTIVFAGIRMAESLKQSEIKMLFYSLYGMTIFTIFNMVVSTYFFIALKHKRGPVGPKGKKGELGDNGQAGICIEDSCLRKSLQEIIVNYIENDSENTANFNLDGKQRKMICSFTNNKKLVTDNIKDFIKNVENKLTAGKAALDELKTIDKPEDESVEDYEKNYEEYVSNFKKKLIDLGQIVNKSSEDGILSPSEIDDQFCQ